MHTHNDLQITLHLYIGYFREKLFAHIVPPKQNLIISLITVENETCHHSDGQEQCCQKHWVKTPQKNLFLSYA